MNTSKVALYYDPDDAPILTPSECIVSMFALTDESGLLLIPAWPYDDDAPEDQARFYRCQMNWNEADRDAALRLFERCYETMREIAPKFDSIRSSGAEALPEAEKRFWNTYLRDFASDDIDAICAEAEERVGQSPAACDVIIRARRLCRLMALHAAEIILQGEANLYAQALVIHGYCKELEIVEDVD